MQLENTKTGPEVGLAIETAGLADIGKLAAFAQALRHTGDESYYATQYEHQLAGRRLVLLARVEGDIAGYCVLNWEPKYAFFRKMGFPEIQDLIVRPDLRRRGIAARLIARCESMARERGLEYMGIGVGLHRAFGPAQRLYIRLGYLPDGNGATYDRQQVAPGEFRPLDDDLCLMMVKDLRG